MAPIEKHVHGLDELLKQIDESNNASSIYVLFCGSKNEKGESWCPDCVKAEPIVYKAAKTLTNNTTFIHCDVGPRDQWKSPNNPFRLDERFRLTAVPTLLKWNTTQRLVEEQCLDEDLLALMFEDDS